MTADGSARTIRIDRSRASTPASVAARECRGHSRLQESDMSVAKLAFLLLIFRPDLGFFDLSPKLQAAARWIAGLRAEPVIGRRYRRPVGASRNDKRERRVSRLRNACIFRLTRPLLRERLFRYGVPTHEEELAMKLRGLFIAAAVLLMPTAALAAPGIVTTTVSLRAGPGEGFPKVDRIPGGARVNIHGCLRGTAWCDVSWLDDRGWVSSQYLEYLYRNRYVYLPDYVDEIDVPVVPFVLTSYWSSYYAGRPWYHRRAYWSGYWQSHERFATRLTIDRSAARIGRAAAARDAALPEAKARVGVEERSRARVEERTRAGVTERTRAGVTERTRTGVTERVTREKDIATRSAREGHERAVQARMTRENARMTRENARAAVREQPMARARARTQTPPIMARGH